MSYIRMDKGLTRKPKFRAILRASGLDEPSLVGYLFLIWSTVDEIGQDMEGTDELIAESVCAPLRLVCAMCAEGWATRFEGGITFHSNDDQTVKRTEAHRARAKESYDRKRERLRAESAHVCAPAPLPHLPHQPHTASPTVSGVPVDSNGAHPKEKRTKDSLTFDRETGWHGVTDADRSVWAEAYPGVDIDHELAAAKAWLLADWAKRRKSAWRRFLVGWLARSQDRASASGQRPANVQRASVERPAAVPSAELPDEKRSSLTIWAAKKLRGLLDPADLAEAWGIVSRWPEDIMYDRLQNVVSQSRDKGAPGKWLAAAIRHEPTGRLRPGECGAL